jgi:queuine tRNA-ribosyltransferase
MLNFNLAHQDKHSGARTGIITTSHGSIRTPAFIPVATQATVKAITPQHLNDIGFDAILCNTYHLYLRPGPSTVKKLHGLPKFMGWNKPTFTDSGGFQVFSLNGGLCTATDEQVTFKSYIDQSSHIFTPERSIQIQKDLGADIIFTFDECIPFDSDYETAKRSLQRTHAWALRCLKEFKKTRSPKQALYGIIQGGKFPDLRKESVEFISNQNFHGFGIGSIFGEPKEETLKLMQYFMPLLPKDKPVHLLGIGSIDDIFNYTELGIDTFDCVLPTRLARVGYIFIRPESGGNLKNKFRYRLTNSKYKEDSSPLDKNCSCYVCKNFSKAYLRHLFKADELLFYTLTTYHNLYFFQRLMEEIRDSIEQDNFMKMKKRWLR